MTDARLRDAERRWRETGAVDDEAAWLRERVRAGDLPDERLRLAAYVGHRPSALALGPAPLPSAYVQAWIYGLERWGDEACLRAAIAAARRALAAIPRQTRRSEPARGWIAHAERAVLRLELAEPPPWDPHALDDDPPERETSAFLAAQTLGHGTSGTRLVDASSCAGGVVANAAEATDEPTIRAAIRDELAPWALGLGDPLRERHG